GSQGVRQGLDVAEAVVGDNRVAAGTEWARENLEGPGNAGDTGRVTWVGQVSQLIDAHQVVVRGEKDHMIDVVVSDEFEQLIALCPVTSIPMFANRREVERNLIDRVGNSDKLPGDTLCLRVQQTLFKPSYLSGPQPAPAPP